MKRKLVALLTAVFMFAIPVLTSCGNTAKESLKKPENLAYSASEGKLTWSAVEGASNGYSVIVKKGNDEVINKTSEQAEYSVSELTEGDYKASVKAKATDDNSESAAATLDFSIASTSLPALTAPTGFSYNASESKISWTAVTNATAGYHATITKTGATTPAIDQDVATTEVNVSSLNANPGEYKIVAYAKAVSATYEKSPNGEYTFNVLATVPTVTNIAYNQATQTISWTASTGASGYKLSAVKYGTTEVSISERTVSSASFDLTTVDGLNVAHNTLSITALGADGESLDSAPESYELTIVANKISAPTGLDFNDTDDILSWSDVANNDGYNVEILNSEQTIIASAYGTINLTFDTASIGKGDFTAKVSTVAPESIFYTDSDAVTEEFTIAGMGTLDAPSNIEIDDDGYMAWDDTEARSVEIKVYAITDTVGTVGSPVSISGETQFQDGNNKLFVNKLGLANGDYAIGVKFLSNRHTNASTSEVQFKVSFASIVSYSAEDIATFDGTSPVGEHASVTLENGYAVVKPTLDGWGRVGSPAFNVDFGRNPIVLLDIGIIEYGFHMQVTFGGSQYQIVDDTLEMGSRNVKLQGADSKESGSLPENGTGSIRLRLGVSNSSTTTANDARASFRQVTVCYISAFVPEDTTPRTLANVSNVRASKNGALTWDYVNEATSYVVTIHNEDDQDDTNDIEVELSEMIYDLTGLEEGIYTTTVTAKSEKAYISDSATPTECTIRINEIKRYEKSEIDTGASGAFVTDGNNIEAENGVLNSSEVANYGWIKAKDGININMTKNPLIVMEVERAQGGYFFHQLWEGQGSFAIRGDTPYTYTGENPDKIILRANIGEGKQSNQATADADYAGEKTGYQIRPGVWNPGGGNFSQLELNFIKIITVESVVLRSGKLDTPENLRKDRTGQIRWDAVSGDTDYTPVYDVTIENLDNSSDIFTLNNVEASIIDLNKLELTNGATYSISVVAKGDNPQHFTDSDAGVCYITYTEHLAISDFTDIEVIKDGRMGEMAQFTITNNTNGLKWDISGDGWGIFSITLNLTGVSVVEDTVLFFKIGAASGGNPTITCRTFDAATGTDVKDVGRGDTAVGAGDVIGISHNGLNNLVDNNLYFGIGSGGGSAGRSVTVSKLVVADYVFSATNPNA